MLTLKIVLCKSWIKRFKGFLYVGVCNFVMVIINIGSVCFLWS